MKKAIPLALFFVGLTLGVLAVPPQIEALQTAMAADDFHATGAEVISRHTESHGKGPSTEVVEFEYIVDGKLYEGDNHLTQFTDTAAKLDRQIREGSNHRRFVRVYYDPDNPEQVLLHRDIGIWIPIGIIVATLLCLLIGVSSYLEQRRIKKRRERRGWRA